MLLRLLHINDWWFNNFIIDYWVKYVTWCLFIYLSIYLFIYFIIYLFSLFYFLLFNDYGKIKICIKRKCLLGLFSLSLLFFQFYNKNSNWTFCFSQLCWMGCSTPVQRERELLHKYLLPSASQGPWTIASVGVAASYNSPFHTWSLSLMPNPF